MRALQRHHVCDGLITLCIDGLFPHQNFCYFYRRYTESSTKGIVILFQHPEVFWEVTHRNQNV